MIFGRIVIGAGQLNLRSIKRGIHRSFGLFALKILLLWIWPCILAQYFRFLAMFGAWTSLLIHILTISISQMERVRKFILGRLGMRHLIRNIRSLSLTHWRRALLLNLSLKESLLRAHLALSTLKEICVKKVLKLFLMWYHLLWLRRFGNQKLIYHEIYSLRLLRGVFLSQRRILNFLFSL